MIYNVSHITTVQYASPVSLAYFNLRLKPVAWPGQTVTNYAITVDPEPSSLIENSGAYLVNESTLSLRDAITRLQVESRFTVDVGPPPVDPGQASGPCVSRLRELALTCPDLTRTSPAAYLFASPVAQAEHDIAAWAGQLIGDAMPIVEAGRALMPAVNAQFEFDSVATLADTPPIEAFHKRRGVCQDFAHIMIIAARAHGIPAAYVSGYLRTLPPPGQQRLVGADAMHAWVNLWCGEELGWIGFDPTNDMFAGSDQIFIAMGRDYGDVAPLDGVFRGQAEQTMFFSVDVAEAG